MTRKKVSTVERVEILDRSVIILQKNDCGIRVIYDHIYDKEWSAFL